MLNSVLLRFVAHCYVELVIRSICMDPALHLYTIPFTNDEGHVISQMQGYTG
jgi:hypothetical protein